MCRYVTCGPYKEPYACFDCRKVFKQTNRWELSKALQPKPGQKRICKCPECGLPMADIGFEFKAPKQTNKKQWEKVRILYNHGFTFHSCCGIARPKDLKDAQEFIAGLKSKSKGIELLKKIKAKVLKQKESGKSLS